MAAPVRMDHRLFWQNIPPPPSIPVPILDPPSSQADGSEGEEEATGKDLLESIETLGWLNIVLKSPTMFPIGVLPSGTFVDKSVVKSPKKYKTSICGCCILIGCLFLGMLILITVGFITTMALASGGNEFELSNFLLQPSSPAQQATTHYHLNFDMENHEVISTKIYKISVYGVLRENSSSTLPGMVIFNGGNSDHFCINRHANVSLSIPVSFTESPLKRGSVESVCARNSTSFTVKWRISILCRHMLGLLSNVDFNATTLLTCPTN